MANVYGTAGNDTLRGTHFNDLLDGYQGNDYILAQIGRDRVFGGLGNDTLLGGDGNDIVEGGAGNDSITGGNGADTLNGGAGNDEVAGNNGNDSLLGSRGNDVLLGAAGNDTLFGGADDDTLFGGTGADNLNGGGGDDRLSAGTGADTFIIGTGGLDTVVDFSRDEGDVLDLRPALDAFVDGRDSISDFVRVSRDPGTLNSLIEIDANGVQDGSVDFQTVASVTGAGYANLGAMYADGAILLPGWDEPDGGFLEARSRVADFREFLGINITISTETPPQELSAKLIDALDYLNIENVRVGSVVEDAPTLPVYAALADHGIDFNFVMRRHWPEKGDEHLDKYVEFFQTFLQQHPDSIKSIEGLNEVGDHWYLTYNGLTGKEAATAYQKSLYEAMKAEAALEDIPILSFTVLRSWQEGATDGFEDVSDFSDFANVHTYIGTGFTPYYELENRIEHVKVLDGNSPTVITEFGYETSIDPGRPLRVDETTQAKLILNLMMAAYEQDVDSAYLFRLLNGRNPDNPNYGVFTEDGVPKEAAHAIHNLTEILYRDTGGGAVDTVGYKLSGGDGSTHSFAMGKTGGVTDLILWQEERLWESATATPIEVDPRMIEIELDEAVRFANVYDPLLGTSYQERFTDTDTFSVEVTDHPIIVEMFL